MIEVELPDGSIAEFPEGTSDDVIKGALSKAFPAQPPAEPAQSGEKAGIANTIDAYGRGVAKAASFGFADELGAGARWLGGKILPWQTEVTYDEALKEVRDDDKATAKAHPIADVAGSVTGAIGAGTGIVRAGLSPTMAVANRGGGTLATTGASLVEGGIYGGLQGFGQGEGLDDRLSQAKEGGAYGAAIGAALPLVVSGVTNLARRVVTPNSTSAARQAQVNVLQREGVPVTAGQATGNNTLRYAESEIGGQVAQDMIEQQGEAFTRAALRRAGANAPRATADVIDDNFRRIGQTFDDLAARNNLVPDRQLATDLGQTAREYMSMVPESQRAPVVMDMIQDIGARLGQGPLDGAAYQAARSRLDRLARGAARDPQLQDALMGIRNALDDGMQRSLRANNIQDLGRWQEVRRQYRNMMTLERASTAAGEKAAEGLISPSALRNATITTQGRRNYARGSGDFAELARAGEAIMKPMPQSGTAPRTAVRNLGAAIPTVLGAGVGGATGGGFGAMLGMAAGATVPQVVGRLMMTPAGQAYLRNQLLTGGISGQTRAAVVAAINQIDATMLPSIVSEESQVSAAAAR